MEHVNQASRVPDASFDSELVFDNDTAMDAEWKMIQKKTFTRWCNEHLKVAQKHISNLETDLGDGVRLIALLEVMSQKRLPRFNKRPAVRAMQMENVSIALEFIKDQNIRLVNIGVADIVDGNLKLILGLIWTLILNYSLMALWESPRELLLAWINGKVPDKPIDNFTTDWNSAQAIGALVDAVAPGLCPDWQDWDPEDAFKNATEVMTLAEDWLDVPQVLVPEDMTNPNVDELSIMTYLSAFPKAKLKPGAPLRPKKVDDSMQEAGYGGN